MTRDQRRRQQLPAGWVSIDLTGGRKGGRARNDAAMRRRKQQRAQETDQRHERREQRYADRPYRRDVDG